MADLTGLGTLQPVEQIDLDVYPETREFQLAKAGRYTLQAPDSFPAASFGRSKAGALKVTLDPTIAGPTNEGTKIRFVNVSAKVFERSGQKASQLGDYLKACGLTGRYSDEQELADAVDQTANMTYEANLDWQARYKDGFEVTGMKNFPLTASGEPQSWVEHPTVKNEDGEPLRLRANLVVTRFISAG